MILKFTLLIIYWWKNEKKKKLRDSIKKNKNKNRKGT